MTHKRTPTKPLSPPISPELKKLTFVEDFNQSKKYDLTVPKKPETKPIKRGQYMLIKPLVTNRSDILRFLSQYDHNTSQKVKGVKSVTKRKVTKLSGLGSHLDAKNSGSKSANNSKSWCESSTSFTKDNTSLQGVSIHDISSSSDQKSELSFERKYSTRSKQKSSQDDQVPDSSKGKSSSKLFQGRDNFKNKKEFLELSNVQDIHDLDFQDIPNCEPALDTIRGEDLEKALKRVGFATNNNLKDNQGLEKVDSKEIVIVSALKLTPNQYVDTKRRFFAERARKTFLKTTFKKTDAQKACRIDVNKSSKLYELFQHCGLLDESLFKKSMG